MEISYEQKKNNKHIYSKMITKKTPNSLSENRKVMRTVILINFYCVCYVYTYT